MELEWLAGPLTDMLADAVAAIILQLQSRLLGDSYAAAPSAAKPTAAADVAVVKVEPDAQPMPQAAAKQVAPVGVAAMKPEDTRAHALRVLAEHFGEIREISPTAAEISPISWELTASGRRVTLRALGGTALSTLPFSVDCEEEEVRERVARLIELAHRAVVPSCALTQASASATQSPAAASGAGNS